MKKNVLTMILTALIMGTIPYVLVAQPEIEWQKSYGGEDEDSIHDIIQTADGGFIMTGIETSFGAEDPDTWIVKTDEDGEIEWTVEIDGYFLGVFRYVLQAEDGGYILCTHNATIIKIDEDGEIIWERNFNHSVKSFIQNVDGGYSLAGDNESDFYITKTDEDCQEVWTSQFGGDESDVCFSHVQSQDDGLMLVGSTFSFDTVRRDGLVVKIDADGEVEWHQTYGGRREDYFTDVLSNEDGSYTMVGYNRSLGDGSPTWLISIDAEGEEIWERGEVNVQGQGNCKLLPAVDGGFTIIGAYYYPGIYRASADGEELWTLRLREVELAHFREGIRAILTNDGGYALGFTDENERNNLAILKLSADPQLGMPGWLPLDAIEINEVELEIEFLLDHIVDINDADSTLQISVENGENVLAYFENDILIIVPKLDWWGSDNIRLIVTDQDDNSADTDLLINVSSVNDPPDPFVLSTPENEWEVNAVRIAFVWEEAEQNEFEIDAVQYSLKFTFDESEYEIYGIQDVVYIMDDINVLIESLGIIDEGEDIEITWSVIAIDEESETVCIEPFTIILPTLGIGNPGDVEKPLNFSLSSAYPNPFNAVTQINFSIAKVGYASLKILDVAGHEVASLINGQVDAGSYTAVWNAGDQAAGIYFYRLRAGGYQSMRKLILIK